MTFEPPTRIPGWQLWLISRRLNGLSEVLSVAGGETLPVFSFEDEARMFLCLGASEAGWEIERTTVGELVWLLNGPHEGVVKVALDPPPEWCGQRLMDLVSLNKEDFIRVLLDGRYGKNRRMRASQDERERRENLSVVRDAVDPGAESPNGTAEEVEIPD